jgi:AcrR family transcriptional regulator
MPKQTFEKIDATKRERLLAAATQLFSERGYAATDMAELAARAGVAKGSLYNYFSSKDELYHYVCMDGLARHRAAVYDGLDTSAGVVSQVRHIFAAGVRFAQAHPDYISLYLNVSSAGMARFAQQMSREVEKFTADHLKRMLRRGIERGEVRADIDVNLTAFLINSLYIIFVSSLVSPHFRIRMREYLEIKGRLTDKAIQDQLERTMELIGSLLMPEDLS